VIRAALTACALALAGTPAHADTPKSPAAQVEALVRALLAQNGEPGKLTAIVRDDVYFVDGSSKTTLNTDVFAVRAIANPKSVHVTVDAAHHVAWFQAVTEETPVDTSGDACHYMGTMCDPQPHPMHVSGLAIDDKGWKLAAVFFTRAMPDKDLLALSKQPYFSSATIPKKPPATSGDADLAKAAAAWLAGLGKSAAAGEVLATGSAPDEVASGAAAVKLASKWDKLKLLGASIDATTVAGGAIGIVNAEVVWPYRKDLAFPLRLAAIAMRDGTTWKWVLLDFGA
jgi:hypothetical protein